MITSWLFKVVLVIAALGFLAIELASPLIVRVQLDGVAHDAATDAARDLARGGDATVARQEAETAVAKEHATLEEFRVDDRGVVHVTVWREAKSYLFHRIRQTRDWYHVRVKAEAATQTS